MKLKIANNNQEVFTGFNSIQNLVGLVDRYKADSILIVHGKTSFTACGAENVINELLADKQLHYFSGFLSNPTDEQVMKGVEIYKKCTPDLVIGIGGGSAIDVAKAIFALSDKNSTVRHLKVKERPVFIAIPTTAGTGSEATHFAVIYKNDIKYSLANSLLTPDVAILDPQFILNLPLKIAKNTLLDAFAQSIESFWSKGATVESREYAARAIRAIRTSFSSYFEDDKNSKQEILEAAYFAGKAINISKTTAPHALSYFLTKKTGLAHGNAVALSLGLFFKLNNIIAREEEYFEYFELEERLLILLGQKDAEDAKKYWLNILKEIGYESSLSRYLLQNNINSLEFFRSINKERLANHPVELNYEKLQRLLTI